MAQFVTRDGYTILVDDEDLAEVQRHVWRVKESKKGGVYVVRTTTEGGRTRHMMLHRQIMRAPSGLFIDHINHNTLDNRKQNLRLTTNSQNQQNRRKVTGRSRFKGVAWHAQCGKWQVLIKLDGKSRYIGIYEDEVQAAKAYDDAARKLFGEYAHTNFSEAA